MQEWRVLRLWKREPKIQIPTQEVDCLDVESCAAAGVKSNVTNATQPRYALVLSHYGVPKGRLLQSIMSMRAAALAAGAEILVSWLRVVAMVVRCAWDPILDQFVAKWGSKNYCKEPELPRCLWCMTMRRRWVSSCRNAWGSGGWSSDVSYLMTDSTMATCGNLQLYQAFLVKFGLWCSSALFMIATVCIQVVEFCIISGHSVFVQLTPKFEEGAPGALGLATQDDLFSEGHQICWLVWSNGSWLHCAFLLDSLLKSKSVKLSMSISILISGTWTLSLRNHFTTFYNLKGCICMYTVYRISNSASSVH